MNDNSVSGELKNIGRRSFRFHSPPGEGPHPVVVMLHGWTGDENAMWIFASRFPKDSMLISPRGIYSSQLGGYSWYGRKAKTWPEIKHFSSSVDVLGKLLTKENFPNADFSQLALVGFSQGAALAYSYALMFPERVRAVAGLSGFLPGGVQEIAGGGDLKGIEVFIAHGTKDNLVDIGRAREAVKFLQEAGAQVTYCEDNVGHKLSVSCFRGLEEFFKKVNKLPG